MSILTDIEDSTKTQLETGTFNSVQYYADLASMPSTSLSLGTGNERGEEAVSDDGEVWKYEVDIGIEGRISDNRGVNISRSTDTVVDEIKTLLIRNNFFAGLTNCLGVVSTEKVKWKYKDKVEMFFSFIITIQYIE